MRQSEYQQTMDLLFQCLPMYQRTGKAAYKANLDNTLALDRALGHPHRQFRSVHIAGTNGKGSVSHMLASVFQEAGYRTGLYTSPHLLDFRERIRINGTMIGEQEVVDFVERIRDLIDTVRPSFFEMTVAMAFDHFAREQVDMAIIETGMGGRLDSTNIITPELSVITSISMDHAEFLGDTPELIAGEKAGIIKPGIPVVTGQNPEQVSAVFAQTAARRGSRHVTASDERTFLYRTYTTGGLSRFHYKDLVSGHTGMVESDLGGTYQNENISLVLSALKILREQEAGRGVTRLTDAAVARGMAAVVRNTGLRGRWETLGANPRIITDTAHNEGGVAAVMEQLLQVPAETLHIVWGMVGDKPVEHVLRKLPSDATYYFTAPSIPRAMPVEQLAEAAEAAGLTGKQYPAVADAFTAARRAAGPRDVIYVGGSTFVVADLLEVTG